MKKILSFCAVLVLFAPMTAFAQDADKARPAAAADVRGPGTNTLHKHLFCVKNAESGACEDCWSDGKVSSARGTCNLLKASTNEPSVREGKCSLPATKRFCAVAKR